MGSSLPLLLFFGFMALLLGLGAFLDALVKRAARAEQEARARARDERARVAAGGAPTQQAVPRLSASTQASTQASPQTSARTTAQTPAPTRRVEEGRPDDLLRQLLGLAPPPAPPPRPRPRPAPVVVARPAPPARAAAPAPASGSLREHHLGAGLTEHHLAASGDAGRPASFHAPAARPAAAPLAVLDRLPPMARAVVLADLLGPPLAARRQLHRARPV